MSQRVYRGNLSAAEFPLTPTDFGASVIVAQQDQTLSRYVDTTESRDASIGIPQLWSASNVLPTKEGFASVRLLEMAMQATLWYRGPFETQPYSATHTVGPTVQYIQHESGTKVPCWAELWSSHSGDVTSFHMVLGCVQVGGFIVYTYLMEVAAPNEMYDISVVRIQGHNVVYVPPSPNGANYWEGCGFEVLPKNDGTVWVRTLSFPALDMSAIKGMLASNGYLLAYSTSAVAWSSTADLFASEIQRSTAYAVNETVQVTRGLESWQTTWRCTTAGTTAATTPVYEGTSVVTDGTAVFTKETTQIDFEPSTVTGAGGGNVEDLRGQIVVCRPSVSGFVAYTKSNAVMASYTQSAEYPYVYRNIPNSSGVDVAADVTDSATAGFHFALTDAGIQQMASTGAKQFEPAIQDWLFADNFTEVEIGTDNKPTIVTGTRTTAYRTAICFLGKRYLCISRGTGVATPCRYSEALIYDTALSRYGKLVLPHNGFLEFEEHLCVIEGFITNTNTASVPTNVPKITKFMPTNALSTVVTPFTVTGTRELGLATFGRFRWVREQQVDLQEALISNLFNVSKGDSRVWALVSSSRNTTMTGTAPLYIHKIGSTGAVRVLGGNKVGGDDFSLVVSAPFKLNTLELVITSGGHR